MKININRLTYCGVDVELTRRCNLKCAHCYRGDAQDKDITPEIIDAFLDHTQAIYQLSFVGGEPTLNLKGMRYFLESMKRHNVFLTSVAYVTNGIVRTQELIDIIRDYSAYIRPFVLPEIDIKTAVKISISNDQYHLTDFEEACRWYRNNLSDVATISYIDNGIVPLKKGRAENISYALPQKLPIFTKLIIKTKDTIDENLLCRYKKMVTLFHPNQVIILCGICVTVTGKILHFNSVSYPWDVIDNIPDSDVICTVFVNSAQEIIDSIEKWNKNRPYCLQDVNRTTGDDVVLALQTVKNNAPSQKIIDDTFGKLLANNLSQCDNAKDIAINSIVAGKLASYLGLNPLKTFLLANRTLNHSKTEKGFINYIHDLYPKSYWDRTHDSLLSGEEQAILQDKAKSAYGYEKYGNNWNIMSQHPLIKYFSLNELDEYDLQLQSLESTQTLINLNPDNANYLRMLTSTKKQLKELFERVERRLTNGV